MPPAAAGRHETGRALRSLFHTTIARKSPVVKFMFFLFIYEYLLYNQVIQFKSGGIGMTISQLAHFYALFQSRNYTQAAKQLYITQPALSKSIAALERELNLKLVERSTRSVALTAAGEEFAQACEEMLDAWRRGLNNARAASGDVSGLVRVGLPRDRQCVSFVPLQQRIRERYPNLRLELRFYSENGLLRALDNHMADFVLALGQPRAEDVCSLPVSSSPLCAVMADTHPLASQTALEFSQLRHEAFLVPEYKLSGVEFDAVIQNAALARFSPHLTHEADSIPQLFTMAACGQGIAVMPRLYQPGAGEHVVFIPLIGLPPMEERLLWRRGNDKCMDAIIQLARAHLAESEAG